MSEFYVGYLPKAPAAIARHIRATVGCLFVLAAIAALVFTSVQKTFAPSTFEFGRVRTFEGTIEVTPYPTLTVAGHGPGDAAASRYLLVAEGKHGADGQVAAFDGKSVQLRGTRIYRDSQEMIEVVNGSISAAAKISPQEISTNDLGIFELTGEIVDSKCYLGVMNPGNGKVHRDCAVRCLSGGIPPLFATNDFKGHSAILVLAAPSQRPLARQAFLDRVAQPVTIHGHVFQKGDTLTLETEQSQILLLP